MLFAWYAFDAKASLDDNSLTGWTSPAVALFQGFRPKTREQLAVVTSVVENGRQRIVPLTTARMYSPGGKTLLDRLVLHFSIGEAY